MDWSTLHESHLYSELQKGELGFLISTESTQQFPLHSSIAEAWAGPSPHCSYKQTTWGVTRQEAWLGPYVLYTNFFCFPWKQSRSKAQERHPPTTKLTGIHILNPVLCPHKWPHCAVILPQSPTTTWSLPIPAHFQKTIRQSTSVTGY